MINILQSVFLQFSAREINQNFSDLFGITALDGVASWTSFLTAVLIFIGVVVFLIGIMKAWKMETEYAGSGEPYGKIKIIRMDGEEITVNLSKNESFFNENNFKQLLKEELIKVDRTDREALRKSMLELQQWHKNGKIFVYDAKIIRMLRAFGYGVRRFNGKAIIISGDELLDNKFSWWDRRGMMSLTSFPRKEKLRKVVAHYISERVVIRSAEKNKMNVWAIVPVPKTGITSDKDATAGFNGATTIPNITLHLNQLPHIKEITQAAILMEVYAETHSQVSHYRKLSEHRGLMNEEFAAKGVEVAIERDIAKLENMQIELVGNSTKQNLKDKANDLVWIFVAAFATYAGTELPNLRGLQEMPPIVASFGLTLLVAVGYIMSNRDKTITGHQNKLRTRR